MQHLSLSPRRLGASLLLGIILLGCGDPAAPNENLAREFDRLASRVSSQSPRGNFLLSIAHTLRRGAPVNKLTLQVDGTARDYNAVAIQWGLEGGPDMPTTVLGWRGPGAAELFHLSIRGAALVGPDTTSTSEDSAVFIHDARGYDAVNLAHDTSEVWYLVSGDGEREVVSLGPSCHALTASHKCQVLSLAVRFAATTRLYEFGSFVNPVPVEKPVATSRTILRGIRYLKVCPATESVCMYSLMDDL